MIRALAFLTTFAWLASVAAAQPPAADDKRRIIGILDVRVEGVPKEIKKQFQVDLEKQLDSREYWLAPQQRVKEMMASSTRWTEGCFVGLCLNEVKAQTGAEIVLLASITGSGTSFGYVVTLVRTDTGRMLAQESTRCEVCTVSEALAGATLAAVKLLTSLPDKLPDDAGEASAALDLATSKLRAEHTATKAKQRTIGIALTLAGVVAAGAGMTVYLAMDRPDGALLGAGVGAGLALGGIVVLTF
ncbi:MAG TPA: hypothetical protein VIV11_28020 [Kofleriaceae bacterium]